MVAGRAAPAETQMRHTAWWPAGGGPPPRRECHVVCTADGLPVADAAARLRPVANSLSLLSALETRRNTGANSRCPAAGGTVTQRSAGHAVGGHHRQSVGENHRKRGDRGYDAGKKITGRKRHIVVDSLGLLLEVVVHPANIQDRDGAKLVLKRLRRRFPRIRTIYADGGYAGKLVTWARRVGDWSLEIVRKLGSTDGFVVLPKRWIVERTFAWLGRSRRLSKDYEQVADSSVAMIQLAMIRLMLRRLTTNPKGC